MVIWYISLNLSGRNYEIHVISLYIASYLIEVHSGTNGGSPALSSESLQMAFLSVTWCKNSCLYFQRWNYIFCDWYSSCALCTGIESSVCLEKKIKLHSLLGPCRYCTWPLHALGTALDPCRYCTWPLQVLHLALACRHCTWPLQVLYLALAGTAPGPCMYCTWSLQCRSHNPSIMTQLTAVPLPGGTTN